MGGEECTLLLISCVALCVCSYIHVCNIVSFGNQWLTTTISNVVQTFILPSLVKEGPDLETDCTGFFCVYVYFLCLFTVRIYTCNMILIINFINNFFITDFLTKQLL